MINVDLVLKGDHEPFKSITMVASPRKGDTISFGDRHYEVLECGWLIIEGKQRPHDLLVLYVKHVR